MPSTSHIALSGKPPAKLTMPGLPSSLKRSRMAEVSTWFRRSANCMAKTLQRTGKRHCRSASGHTVPCREPAGLWASIARMRPGEASFCRIRSPIVVLWGKKTVKMGRCGALAADDSKVRQAPRPVGSAAFTAHLLGHERPRVRARGGAVSGAAAAHAYRECSGTSALRRRIAGKMTEKVEPLPTVLVMRSAAPWRCSTCLTIASPSPVPPVSRERLRSTR